MPIKLDQAATKSAVVEHDPVDRNRQKHAIVPVHVNGRAKSQVACQLFVNFPKIATGPVVLYAKRLMESFKMDPIIPKVQIVPNHAKERVTSMSCGNPTLRLVCAIINRASVRLIHAKLTHALLPPVQSVSSGC